jgi:hypothetical protein
VLAVVGGCASAAPPVPAPAESATAHSERAQVHSALPRATLTRLSDAAAKVSAGPAPDTTPGALRDLASAIELSPNGGWLAAEAVRQAAKRLETSAPGSPPSAGPVKEGLGRALATLVARPAPDGHAREYQQALRALALAVQAIDGQRPLAEQHASIAAGFRAAADVVYLAAGGEAPFGEAETGHADDGRQESQPSHLSPQSFGSAVEHARAEVLALGQTDWTQVQPAAARVLVAMANAVAAADRLKAHGRNVSDINFLAERVRYADALSYGRAAWIKAALSSALDALESLGLLEPQRLSVWTDAARRAIASIEERKSLAFQRAAVQDAFRATIDAFVAATQSG